MHVDCGAREYGLHWRDSTLCGSGSGGGDVGGPMSMCLVFTSMVCMCDFFPCNFKCMLISLLRCIPHAPPKCADKVNECTCTHKQGNSTMAVAVTSTASAVAVAAAIAHAPFHLNQFNSSPCM